MKTCEEWSLEFDLLYNNIASDKAPGLEEYEKSVFLTRAEQTIEIALYKGNFGESFESTEELTAYLDSLVRQAELTEIGETDIPKISENSYIFKNPDDLLFRTIELCTVQSADCGELTASVVPVTQDEYWRTVRDPFKRHNNTRVLRLSTAKDTGVSGEYEREGYTELISSNPVSKYTVRYLAKAEPIILEDLTDGKSIDGKTAKATCKMHEALHHSILAEAVRMAKAAWNT